MINNERSTVSAWDLLRPTSEQLRNIGAVARGVGLLARSKYQKRLTVATLIEAHAARRPQHPALVFETQVWSYAEFNAAANRYARVLKTAGIGGHDVVAILADNRPDTLLLVAALAKLGAAAAMCNTKQRGDVLAHSLGTVAPRAIVVGDELADAFEPIRGHEDIARIPAIWPLGNESAPPGGGDIRTAAADQPAGNLAESRMVASHQTCFYIFTSGTTGMPKASRMSHARWLRGGAGLGLLGLRLTAHDRLYCALPLYHNNALTVSWASVLCAGATFCLARKFSVSRFWDDIRVNRATVFSYIGELCRYLLAAEPNGDRDHDLRAIIGNGLRPDIWDQFKSRFAVRRICEFYGASEGNLVFVNGFNVDRTAGFCPLAFAVVAFDPQTEAPRVDADGRMREVARGEAGLLLTKITDFAPFEGYTDAAAGDKKLYRGVFKTRDCYFDTGDLVRRQGMRHIAFVDRLGDTFRWKGENVATTEVENTLNGFKGVEEAVVYGVAVPGADGRAGMAAITPADSADSLNWRALAEHARAALPAYAVPVFARIQPQTEITGTLKYRKVDLKNDGYAPDSADTVYLLRSADDAYRPIDKATREALDAGTLSL